MKTFDMTEKTLKIAGDVSGETRKTFGVNNRLSAKQEMPLVKLVDF